MFRTDLDAAGVPYAIDGPDGPRYADFHSLRHSMIALLDKAGATLREGMQLARHSDPKLMMAVYGRAHLHDLGADIGRLPSLLPTSGSGRTVLALPLVPNLYKQVVTGRGGCGSLRLTRGRGRAIRLAPTP
jgi:hypothetical protein